MIRMLTLRECLEQLMRWVPGLSIWNVCAIVEIFVTEVQAHYRKKRREFILFSISCGKDVKTFEIWRGIMTTESKIKGLLLVLVYFYRWSVISNITSDLRSTDRSTFLFVGFGEEVLDDLIQKTMHIWYSKPFDLDLK